MVPPEYVEPTLPMQAKSRSVKPYALAALSTFAGLVGPILAQDSVELDGPLQDELQQFQLRREASANPRDLTVLTPTMAPEEIDRAVLNRLLQEITADPDASARQLGASAEELDGIAVTIANARGFINDNEMANIRAMCRAWNNSTADEAERIAEALEAYRQRRQFTLDFIARFYQMVLFDIEAILSAPTLSRFHAYLDDRRRRLANAGTVTPGIAAANVSSGAEAVAFHCRRGD